MDPVTLALLSTLLTVICYIIYQAWKINQYWKDRGVPHEKPLLILGNALPLLMRKMTPGELHDKICKQFPNEPLVGFYDFLKPTLLVRDVDYVEKVLIKDFMHFVDHGLPLDEERTPLDSHLFSMTGKRWKAVRNKLSPIFTTGKLKMMFDSMAQCGDQLIVQMDKKELNDVDITDILVCFGMDTIGSCAFGIDAGNLAQPDNEFRRIGKNALKLDTKAFIRFLLMTQFPKLQKYFNITFTKPEVVKYFSEVIKDTLKQRRENNYARNDFVQLLMQLQDKGFVEIHTKDANDDYLNIDTNTYTLEKFEMTDEQLTGHAVSFLVAGFEATMAAVNFTLYELSRHPLMQNKVRDEINKNVKQEGSLTYDAIKEMCYLEQCAKEALRMYPPPPMLLRLCTKEYTFPNGLTIPAGQPLLIPIPAIHNDPKYYPDPFEFKPDRFDPDNSIPTCAFMPFGNGPRICIAMRFAMLEIKFCLAKLLMNYSFKVSQKTNEPIVVSKNSFITVPKDPVFYNIEKLRK